MGEWADIDGMGNLQVHQVIFGDQARADFVGEAHVAHNPIGSFECFRRMVRGIPGKLGAAVRNFGGIDFVTPFVVVCFLIISVIGLSSIVRMPVDLFPPIRIPVVVVATFFSGMPPEQIESDITGRFERFFTLASGVDHIESRSLPGVSLIKIYFQPGFDADSAVTSIANLALADLRKLLALVLDRAMQFELEQRSVRRRTNVTKIDASTATTHVRVALIRG